MAPAPRAMHGRLLPSLRYDLGVRCSSFSESENICGAQHCHLFTLL